MPSKYQLPNGKFDLAQFCKDNPGIKNWNPGGRPAPILSQPPVACITGKECYIPRYDLYWDGGRYKCPKCNRNYIYIIPYRIKDMEIGKQYKPSGWYLQNPSIVDIIKSWFKH